MSPGGKLSTGEALGFFDRTPKYNPKKGKNYKLVFTEINTALQVPCSEAELSRQGRGRCLQPGLKEANTHFDTE